MSPPLSSSSSPPPPPLPAAALTPPPPQVLVELTALLLVHVVRKCEGNPNARAATSMLLYVGTRIVTRHTSHVTPYTSHLTPHTLHLTRNSSPISYGCKWVRALQSSVGDLQDDKVTRDV